MYTKGMKDVSILQDDIDKMFAMVEAKWPGLDISDQVETYAFVTDVDTNELRLEPDSLLEAERLLNDLVFIYGNGYAP